MRYPDHWLALGPFNMAPIFLVLLTMIGMRFSVALPLALASMCFVAGPYAKVWPPKGGLLVGTAILAVTAAFIWLSH